MECYRYVKILISIVLNLKSDLFPSDETPINCERFLNNNGMEFFVSCMEKFSDCPGIEVFGVHFCANHFLTNFLFQLQNCCAT